MGLSDVKKIYLGQALFFRLQYTADRVGGVNRLTIVKILQLYSFLFLFFNR